MNWFQTMITKVKVLGAAIRTKASVFMHSDKVTRVISRIKGVTSKVVTASTLTNLKAFAKFTGQMYLVSAAFVVVSRFITNPRSVKKLWTDRKNNWRRLLALAWTALTVTLSAYYLTFAWAFVKPVLAILVVVTVACVVRDYIWQLRNNGVIDPSSVAKKHFAPARFTLRMAYMFLVGWAGRIANYTPLWLAMILTPLHFDDLPTTKSETVFDNEKVADTEEVTETAEEASTHTDEVVVELDGDKLRANPIQGGKDLAENLFVEHDENTVKAYRVYLPKELRKTGLDSREIALVLHGYDEVVKAVVPA